MPASTPSAAYLNQIIEAEGREVFYIFDSLSALVVEMGDRTNFSRTSSR